MAGVWWASSINKWEHISHNFCWSSSDNHQIIFIVDTITLVLETNSSIFFNFVFKTHTTGFFTIQSIICNFSKIHNFINFHEICSLKASLGTMISNLSIFSFNNTANIVSVFQVQVGITIVNVWLLIV